MKPLLDDFESKKRFMIREPTVEMRNLTRADQRENRNPTGNSSTEISKCSIGEEFNTKKNRQELTEGFHKNRRQIIIRTCSGKYKDKFKKLVEGE